MTTPRKAILRSLVAALALAGCDHRPEADAIPRGRGWVCAGGTYDARPDARCYRTEGECQYNLAAEDPHAAWNQVGTLSSNDFDHAVPNGTCHRSPTAWAFTWRDSSREANVSVSRRRAECEQLRRRTSVGTEFNEEIHAVSDCAEVR